MIKTLDELNLVYPYSIYFNEDTQKFEVIVLVRTEYLTNIKEILE